MGVFFSPGSKCLTESEGVTEKDRLTRKKNINELEQRCSDFVLNNVSCNFSEQWTNKNFWFCKSCNFNADFVSILIITGPTKTGRRNVN